MINYSHGLHVDKDNNIWVSDGRALDNGKGHTVMKFNQDGKLLMTLGKPGVWGATINCNGTSAHWPGGDCTANNSVPLPLRPSVFLTTTSNPPTYAVLETVIFAVSVLVFTNAVELTVTPPGFVVPLINHWALAPALKPLPPTVTLRLIVP